MCANILVLVIAVFVGLSEAIPSALKQTWPDPLERYDGDIRAKRSNTKRSLIHSPEGSTNQDCPVYQCYQEVGDEDMTESCSAFADCLEAKMEDYLCNCTFMDIVWAQGEVDSCHAADGPSLVHCEECQGKLDGLLDPFTLPFSCRLEDVDEAEECLAGLTNGSLCLGVLAGFPIQQDAFFEGLRLQMAGCPLTAIALGCVFESQHPSYNFDVYSICVIKRATLSATSQCIRYQAASIESCQITETLQRAIEESLLSLYEQECGSVDNAKLKFQGCCNDGNSTNENWE